MKSQYISTLTNITPIRKDDPNEVYKKPIPLDMINKYVGLDSRILIHDDTVQKQAFDQAYKNFWSFVDFNMKYGDNMPVVVEKCNHIHSKCVKPSSSVTNAKMCSGCYMTYEEARQKAYGGQ